MPAQIGAFENVTRRLFEPVRNIAQLSFADLQKWQAGMEQDDP